MKRYLSVISIIVLVIGIFSVGLTKYSDFFADYYLKIVPVSIIIALILALVSEKSWWRTIALWLIAIAVILIILLFVIMGFFWNEP